MRRGSRDSDQQFWWGAWDAIGYTCNGWESASSSDSASTMSTSAARLNDGGDGSATCEVSLPILCACTW